MNKTEESGEENHYYELDSVKKETDVGIYDDVASESATAVTQQTSYENCMQGAEEKRQASTEHECASQCDTVVLRRMLFVVAAVAVVAFLTAIATLILALTAMKPGNDSTAQVQGKQNYEYFRSRRFIFSYTRDHLLRYTCIETS